MTSLTMHRWKEVLFFFFGSVDAAWLLSSSSSFKRLRHSTTASRWVRSREFAWGFPGMLRAQRRD